MEKLTFRPPAVAGMFYPAERERLSRDLDRMLDASAGDALEGELVAMIVPHAGYQYSGATAAAAYALLRGRQFDAAVIVSPSHREYFDSISVFSGAGYLTPLGSLCVDESLRAALLKGERAIGASTRGHGSEHAVEVQLPFLQRACGVISILPVVMGDQRRENCFLLGKKLASILAGRKTLLLASSDLSHYHSYPEAEALDRVFIDDVRTFDADRLMDHLEGEATEACGGGPAVAVMVAARLLGADTARILHHCNSGDITGDRAQVVGYLSAAFTRVH
jgi:AmmeMemoRadiSam system protein B